MEVSPNERSGATPDASLPPLVPDGPRRKMLVEIEVSANFEQRLDNQWEVEREINADRWRWRWAVAGSEAEQLAEAVAGRDLLAEEVARLSVQNSELRQDLAHVEFHGGDWRERCLDSDCPYRSKHA